MRPCRGRSFLFLLIAVSVLEMATVARSSAASDGAEFFEKNVRPLLAQNCFACHSAASQPPMSGLRLDSREGMEKGGSRGPAIVAGKPQESRLIRAVRQVDDRLRMPPTDKLKDAEIAILAQWVEMGAPWGTPEQNARLQSRSFGLLFPHKIPQSRQ